MASRSRSAEFAQVVQPLVRGVISLVNQQRLTASPSLGYVVMLLPETLPALSARRNFIQDRLMGRSSLSLLELEHRFERLAADPRIKGVILYIQGFAMPLADLQSLRDSIHRLRDKGKRVIAYAQRYEMASYYVACAADEIWLQPGGGVAATGLVQQQNYLREALDTLGLQADAVAITPYKSAMDTFVRTDPSPESRDQMNWLLDSQYEMLIEGIAVGRHISLEDARHLVDVGSYTDFEARDAHVVDVLLSEEGFPKQLNTHDIKLWDEVDAMLPLRLPTFGGRHIALLRVGGLIVQGESAQPPVDIPLPLIGGERMGDLTVVRQIRNLMQDENVAALVLFIDSGGGSASASEAIASALDEFAKTRPVVVYMNNVAASGGYYIATPADWIVTQPGTITGSIGVFSVKLVNTEALRKLRFHPYTYLRGENASMFTSVEPFTEAQREKMRQYIERIYQQFKERVGAARKMKDDEVEAVSGGRVWTGRQAFGNRLVDANGGLYDALAKARELARVPDDMPFVIVHGKGKPLPAQLAEQMNPAAALRYWQMNIQYLTNGAAQMLMPFEIR